MRVPSALAIGIALSLTSCGPSQQERQARIDAVNLSTNARFAEIVAERESRMADASTDQERAAVMQWQRDAFTDAIREQQAQISAIQRGE